jgi:hypothetical protein
VFAAQLTDVKSNRQVGSGQYSCLTLKSEDRRKMVGALARQLQGESSGGASGSTAASGSRSSSGGKSNGAAYAPDGIDLVYVEGSGSGIFGVPGFYIGKYEVTQKQWRAVMGNNPSNWTGDNLPVEQVSWNDVQQFLTKLNQMTGRNYRLPTEAEWEYAAQGGSQRNNFEYAGSNNVGEVAWYDGNSGNRTHTVDTKSPNSIGIHDMTGNVWEWCSDWYDSNQTDRVNRGGSWSSTAAGCRVAARGSDSPGDSGGDLCFRLVLP